MLGNNVDWESRAVGADGNTEAPLLATEEWCAAPDVSIDDTGYELSTTAGMSCASVVPVIAAGINAEYARFVTRAHISYFKNGFDIFCNISSDEINEGCASAKFGFGIDASFNALCEDGQLATFHFLKTVKGNHEFSSPASSPASSDSPVFVGLRPWRVEP